jgi:sulfopyruvate decarboxylase subunit beta
MRRIDALKAIYPELEGRAVVTIMGAVAAELHSLGHRESFFYLEHAMGLASSMGLGVALARPELDVVVLDGDGSILMNLGSLTTMARYRPPNLVHVVFDNEVLLSVGKSFTTATATGSDVAAIAAAAGVPVTGTYRDPAAFAGAFREALGGSGPATLVAKVDPSGPASYFIDVHMLENRFQFERWLRSQTEGAS